MAGLTELAFLVVNHARDADAVVFQEDYRLPILQDTEEDDVHGLYGASDYDVFIVDRDGFVRFVERRFFPESDGDRLLDALLELR